MASPEYQQATEIFTLMTDAVWYGTKTRGNLTLHFTEEEREQLRKLLEKVATWQVYTTSSD